MQPPRPFWPVAVSFVPVRIAKSYGKRNARLGMILWRLATIWEHGDGQSAHRHMLKKRRYFSNV
jgi:hypothetical protein